jgi:hypothetical protein
MRPSSGVEDASSDQWQHTPWGRIFVGLLLAQGLYHGLRQLCTAGLLATTEQGAGDVWSTLFGLLLQQSLMGIGLLVGGALAGAGQRRAILFGMVLGVWNGLFFVFFQRWAGEPLTQVSVYGQPILHAVIAAVGAVIGSFIWKPLPALSIPDPRPTKVPRVRVAQRARPSLFTGPVAWPRVLAGVAVAVGGIVWAKVILDFVMEASQGKLNITSTLQAQLVTWEISAVATLVGGGLAGATTLNGLKQGLWVGVGAGVVLTGIYIGGGNLLLEKLILTLACTLVLTLAGSWFGCQLFPPVLVAPRRKRAGFLSF